MFKMFRLLHPEKEFAKEFEIGLIRENSRRLQLFFSFVGISQIIFILFEAVGVLPWQTDIFIYRLLLIGFCAIFIGLIKYANKIDASERSVMSLRVTTSIVQLLSMMIGCYFNVYMFNTGIYSFSTFLIVGFIVSLTCMRNPYFSGGILFVFYTGLTVYLNLFKYPLNDWIGEFLIALLFIFIIHIGNILNYNRHVKIFMQEKKIMQMNRELKDMSETDQLTEIYNRRVVLEKIEEYAELSKRYQTPFSLAMVDIDHFKAINDNFGHNVGDVVLRQLADHVKSRLRSTDIFGRWGGEEFIILVPNDAGDGAYMLVESLRKHTEEFAFATVGKVTFSAGISVYKEGDSDIDLIKKADDALYKAKKSGRNQTQLYHFEDACCEFYEEVNNGS